MLTQGDALKGFLVETLTAAFAALSVTVEAFMVDATEWVSTIEKSAPTDALEYSSDTDFVDPSSLKRDCTGLVESEE